MDARCGISDAIMVIGCNTPFQHDAKWRKLFQIAILGCASTRPVPEESCI